MKINFKLDFGAKTGMQPALRLVYSFGDRGLQNRCFSRGGRQGGGFHLQAPHGDGRCSNALPVCWPTPRDVQAWTPARVTRCGHMRDAQGAGYSAYNHTRSLSTVGCSTIRNSVANLSRPSAGHIPNGIQRALQQAQGLCMVVRTERLSGPWNCRFVMYPRFSSQATDRSYGLYCGHPGPIMCWTVNETCFQAAQHRCWPLKSQCVPTAHSRQPFSRFATLWHRH